MKVVYIVYEKKITVQFNRCCKHGAYWWDKKGLVLGTILGGICAANAVVRPESKQCLNINISIKDQDWLTLLLFQ